MKTEMMLLNNYLKDKYYLVGDNVTIADVIVATHLIVSFQTLYDAGYRKAIPNATEWFERISSLPSFVKYCAYVKLVDKPFKPFDGKSEPTKQEAPAKQEAKGGKKDKGGKKKEEEVDMDDLFGDDDDEDAKAVAEKIKADQKKKKKKVVIAMSLVLLEVKPLDDKTDLDKLAAYIFKNLTQEGLYWKTEYKKEPVAFGIFKLIIGFSLEDEKVSVDDVVEKIEALDDQVQSVEIQAFNKI